jgi:crossover junction endodeoxyribonuclease RusA
MSSFLNVSREVHLELPWPPGVNHYKTVGRLTKTRKGKLYQARINTLATRRFYHEVWAIWKNSGLEGLGKSRLSMYVQLFPGDLRKRDIDGPLKCLLDSMQHAGVYEDDNQIDSLLITRLHPVDGGRVTVLIQAQE